MIKKTVKFKDYDDRPVTEDLWFHLKVDVLTDNLALSDRLEKLQEMFEGEKRELTTAEKQEILDVVKIFINLSYGKRVVVDGQTKFRQRPELVDDFRDSAGYDAFLWALFQDPKGAMSFLTDVMPADLVEQAKKAEEAQGPKRPQDRQQKQTNSQPTVSGSVVESLDDSQVDDTEETAEQKKERLLAEIAALG